jgi:hypothetical protein
VLARARRTGTSFEDALLDDDEIAARLPEDVVASLARPDTGAAGAMVDEVIARARAARASEAERRP